MTCVAHFLSIGKIKNELRSNSFIIYFFFKNLESFKIILKLDKNKVRYQDCSQSFATMIRKFLLFVFVITCVTVNSQFQPNYYDQLNVGSNNFQYRQPYIGYRISPGFPNRISNDASPISNNHITQSPLQQVEQNLRISEQKCKEYTELAKNSILLGSLSFRPSIQTIKSEQCGATQGLIVGGENAKPGEFPHMAALGYPYLNGIKYQCGGTLISDRYVLTAAHCRLTNNLKPSLVRLGDHNLRTKEANLPEESVPIVKFISHEQYDLKSSKNDIAIIRC